MKKVFLAAPFKSLVNSKTMSMDEEKKNEIVNLIEFLEKKGYSVHNAHKREAWGQEFMSPEQCTKIDYDEIEKGRSGKLGKGRTECNVKFCELGLLRRRTDRKC